MTTLKIAIIGPVSTGKSTLINAFLLDTFADTKMVRTTMHPTIYRESDRVTVKADHILRINERHNREAKNVDSGNSSTGSNQCLTITFDVNPIQSFINKPKNINFELYDIPGLNDGHTNVFYDYLKVSIHMFDLIICVFDINSALNTQDELNVLTFLKRECTTIKIIFILNKCDSMTVDEDGKPTFIDSEFDQNYNQACKTIESNCQNMNYRITCVSLNDIYMYRLKRFNPSAELDEKFITKIVENEIGKTKTIRMTKEEKYKKASELMKISNQDFEIIMQNSGYTNLSKLIAELFNKNAQYDVLLQRLFEKLQQLKSTDNLTTIDEWLENTIKVDKEIKTLQASYKHPGNCELMPFLESNCIVIKAIFEREIQVYAQASEIQSLCRSLTIINMSNLSNFGITCDKFISYFKGLTYIHNIRQIIKDIIILYKILIEKKYLLIPEYMCRKNKKISCEQILLGIPIDDIFVFDKEIVKVIKDCLSNPHCERICLELIRKKIRHTMQHKEYIINAVTYFRQQHSKYEILFGALERDILGAQKYNLLELLYEHSDMNKYIELEKYFHELCQKQ